MSHLIEEKLSNGIRVIIDQGSAAGTVAIGMAFGVGSRHETPQENGIAHILEHNIFNGTDQYTAEEIIDRAADMGVAFNARTGKEDTLYFMVGMASQAAPMTDLLADIVTRSIFPENKFEMERGAILQEIKRGKDDTQHVLYNSLQRNIYSSHPIGQSVIGPAKNVSAISRETMIDFFHENYNTSTMIVTVAGAVDPESMIKKLENRLKDIPNGIGRKVDSPTFGIPNHTHIQRDEMSQIQSTIAFPAVPNLDPDYPSLSMASRILGSGMKSHLFRDVRVDKGLVYDIGAGFHVYRDTGTININFGTGPENINETVETIRTTLQKFTTTVTEDELRQSKTRFATAVSLFNESVENRMQENANFMTLRGKTISPAEEVSEMNSVTLSSVKKAFEKIIDQKPYTATIGSVEKTDAYMNFKL